MPGYPASGSPDDENWGMQCTGPHMAFSSSWACQTSQLSYSQWQQTPSLFFLPNINLPLSVLWIMGCLPETKPNLPSLYNRNHGLSFCWISSPLGDVPVPFTTTRDCWYLFLFNKLTKQQIYILSSRCYNRFVCSWPKTCKGGLCATAVSEVLALWGAVEARPSVEVCVQNGNLLEELIDS